MATPTPPVHQPTPVNQFYRLDYDEVHKVWVKTTRWNHTHANAAGHVINWDSVLCMAGGGAMLLDAHTGGAKRASPGAVHDHQSDMSGGIGVDDVQRSLLNGWGETVSTPANFSWADSMDALSNRHPLLMAVDYSLVPDAYALQASHDFDHAILLLAIRADGSVLRGDTLGTSLRWVPQSAYRPGAEAIALREGRTRDQLFVAAGRARPILSAADTLKFSVHPQRGTPGYPSFRYFGLYTVTGGVVTRAERLRTGGFSGTADNYGVRADGTVPWPGHNPLPLMRVTSHPQVGGRDLHGYYIRSEYAVG